MTKKPNTKKLFPYWCASCEGQQIDPLILSHQSAENERTKKKKKELQFSQSLFNKLYHLPDNKLSANKPALKLIIFM